MPFTPEDCAALMKTLGLGAGLPEGCRAFADLNRPKTAPASLAVPPAAAAVGVAGGGIAPTVTTAAPAAAAPFKERRTSRTPTRPAQTHTFLRRNQSNATRAAFDAGWNLKEGHTKRVAHPQENVGAEVKSVAQMYYASKSPRGKEQIQAHEERRRPVAVPRNT